MYVAKLCGLRNTRTALTPCNKAIAKAIQKPMDRVTGGIAPAFAFMFVMLCTLSASVVHFS